ncbi:MAG: hypothetical protein IAG13_24795 [Deltaproteobacteria bacterium]|nr:hypothetical protein [Nannocystaceae bacterium]
MERDQPSPSSTTKETFCEMDTLGLTVGETYAMDIFHAERHTNESNFRIETTIECFVTPPPPA